MMGCKLKVRTNKREEVAEKFLFRKSATISMVIEQSRTLKDRIAKAEIPKTFAQIHIQ
jgi:hypothetical protein